MACHIQIFALSRWLSANLPIEYYEFAKGIEWSIPYMRLPWEGPAADPYLGYSTMPAIAYSESELLDRSAVGGAANISSYRHRGQQGQPVTPAQIIPSDPVFPTEIPEDGKPTPPVQTPGGDATPPVMPVQTPLPLDGMPLTAMEYRSFFEVRRFYLRTVTACVALLFFFLTKPEYYYSYKKIAEPGHEA